MLFQSIDKTHSQETYRAIGRIFKDLVFELTDEVDIVARLQSLQSTNPSELVSPFIDRLLEEIGEYQSRVSDAMRVIGAEMSVSLVIHGREHNNVYVYPAINNSCLVVETKDEKYLGVYDDWLPPGCSRPIPTILLAKDYDKDTKRHELAHHLYRMILAAMSKLSLITGAPGIVDDYDRFLLRIRDQLRNGTTTQEDVYEANYHSMKRIQEEVLVEVFATNSLEFISQLITGMEEHGVYDYLSPFPNTHLVQEARSAMINAVKGFRRFLESFMSAAEFMGSKICFAEHIFPYLLAYNIGQWENIIRDIYPEIASNVENVEIRKFFQLRPDTTVPPELLNSLPPIIHRLEAAGIFNAPLEIYNQAVLLHNIREIEVRVQLLEHCQAEVSAYSMAENQIVQDEIHQLAGSIWDLEIGTLEARKLGVYDLIHSQALASGLSF